MPRRWGSVTAIPICHRHNASDSDGEKLAQDLRLRFCCFDESDERHQFLCYDPTTDRHASRNLGGDPILVRTEANVRHETDDLLR